MEVTSNNPWLYLYEGIYYLVGGYFALNWKEECESNNLRRSKICLIGLMIFLAFNVYTLIMSGIHIFVIIIFRFLFCI